MSIEECINKVIEFASRYFGVDKAGLDEDSTWKDDLHIDVAKSLQDRRFVDFKNALDEAFEIEIPNIKFGKTKTIREMAEFISDMCEE
jgi:acyl carrier protein